MHKRFHIFVLAIAVVMIGGSIVWAQGKHRAHCSMGGAGTTQTANAPQASHCPNMADLSALNLTAAQAKQVKEIQGKAQQAMMPHQQTVKSKQQAIADALKADKPNAAAIKRLVADQGAAMTACRQTMVDAQLALKKVLTAEQYAKLPACPMLAGKMDCDMQGQGKMGCGMQGQGKMDCGTQSQGQKCCGMQGHGKGTE